MQFLGAERGFPIPGNQLWYESGRVNFSFCNIALSSVVMYSVRNQTHRPRHQCWETRPPFRRNQELLVVILLCSWRLSLLVILSKTSGGVRQSWGKSSSSPHASLPYVEFSSVWKRPNTGGPALRWPYHPSVNQDRSNTSSIWNGHDYDSIRRSSRGLQAYAEIFCHTSARSWVQRWVSRTHCTIASRWRLGVMLGAHNRPTLFLNLVT